MPIRKIAADEPAPTDAELGVLRVLWERGASTVREVFEVIAAGKAVGYTTVLKQMQVMHQKGLLTRSERFRSHVYEPAVERSVTQRQLASTILVASALARREPPSGSRRISRAAAAG